MIYMSIILYESARLVYITNMACEILIKETRNFIMDQFNGKDMCNILRYIVWNISGQTKYDNMITSWNGKIFRVTGHLCGEFTGHRWIHRTKASDAELWCFPWSASK